METTRDFLRLVKLATGARSDYRLAQVLGVVPSSVRHWNKGTTLSDDVAIRVARILHQHEGYVLACMAAERSLLTDQRAVWADVAEKLRNITAALIVALFAAFLWELTAPPELGLIPAASAAENFTPYTLCNQRQDQA